MRHAAQVFFAYITLLLTGAFHQLIPVSDLLPDFVSLFAIYLGLTARDKIAPSTASAVLIGYLADLLVGSPAGLLAFIAGVLCIAGHLIQGRLLVRGFASTAVFSALTALAAGILILIIRGASGLLPAGFLAEMGTVVKTAALTGLVGPFAFRGCRYVDARFARTQRERDAAATGLIS